MSITKRRPGRIVKLCTLEREGGICSAASFQTSEQEITYSDGPKYSHDGRLNWKTCTHQKGTQVSGTVASTTGFNTWYNEWHRFGADVTSPKFINIPTGSSAQQAQQQAWDKYWASLDLNCRNRVLAYSAVIQLIPMLGTALKVTNALKRISKQVGRTLRRKPFAEVIRDLIQRDLITRFVIQPTIADMNMLRDAHCYVLRVLETAHTRNAMPYQFTGTGYSGAQDSRQTCAWSYRLNSYFRTRVDCEEMRFGGVESTLRILSQVYYDVHTVKPLELWLARCGLSTPLDAAWDLIPFSFVVDYFFRIGDFIEQVSTKSTSQDGLKGRVGRIYGAWFCEKAGQWNVYRPNGEILFEGGHAYHSVSTEKGTQTFTKDLIFKRFPAPMLGESRFWDNPLLNANGLSTTQKRTLVELAIQLVA